MVMVMVIAPASAKYFELLGGCPGMARAEVVDMAITSAPAAKIIANLSDAQSSATCTTCSAVVELTVSLLMNGGRIVGCPSCEWSAAHARATRAACAGDGGFPVRAPA